MRAVLATFCAAALFYEALYAAQPERRLAVVSKEQEYQDFLKECDEKFRSIVGNSVLLSKSGEITESNAEYRASYLFNMLHDSEEVSGPYSFQCNKKPGGRLYIKANI